MNLSLFRSIRSVSGWLACAAALVFCTTLARAEGEPDITLTRIDALRLERDRGTLDLTLQVHNRRGIGIDLQAVRFRLFLADVEVGEGESKEAVRIAAQQGAPLAVRVRIDRVSELALLLAMSAGQTVGYTIKGIAEIGLTGLPVPFSHAGTVRLGRRER